MKKKEKDFILLTDKGIVAQRGMGADEVIAKLLYALLAVWDGEKADIDIMEAADRVLDLLVEESAVEETECDCDPELEDILEYLFGDDDDEA